MSSTTPSSAPRDEPTVSLRADPEAQGSKSRDRHYFAGAADGGQTLRLMIPVAMGLLL